MHPAFSIIVFTTLSGLGYGLAAVLGLGVLDPGFISTKVAHVAALGLIGAGLISSTLHLGNPQRAWRAFSQWRSSWLSREGVMAVFTFVPLTISAVLALFWGAYSPVVGVLGALGCAVTVYCTAMIYASLRSIDAWHTGLTPLCYLLFALSGGLLLGGVAMLARSTPSVLLSLSAIIALAAAWVVKWMWWQRLRTLTPTSTPESATGLGALGRVRLFERPHVNDNYLTREMGYRVGRKHAVKLSIVALGIGGVVPAALLLIAVIVGAGSLALFLQVLASLLFAAAIAVERWLFFAEARHAVMNYY